MQASLPIRKSRKAGALALLLALSACNSTGGNKIDNALGTLAEKPGQNQTADRGESFDPQAYCPKTVMRAGTETYDGYPPNVKKDDPEREKKLVYRATITDVVRECQQAGDVLNMRVGVAGRLISGPGGDTGDFTLPVRIAITQGNDVLYSKLHDVPATIPAGRTNNKFSFVDDAISFPKPRQKNVIVYVGFDELRVDLPNAVPPKDALEPVN